jgi:hypothetical protein
MREFTTAGVKDSFEPDAHPLLAERTNDGVVMAAEQRQLV